MYSRYYGLSTSAYEQAVREQKMRTEMSQARRENAHYLHSIEKKKEIEAIVGRKRKRGVSEEELWGVGRREHKQRAVVEAGGEVATARLSDSLLRKVGPVVAVFLIHHRTSFNCECLTLYHLRKTAQRRLSRDHVLKYNA